jgi:hypothetical protein
MVEGTKYYRVFLAPENKYRFQLNRRLAGGAIRRRDEQGREGKSRGAATGFSMVVGTRDEWYREMLEGRV